MNAIDTNVFVYAFDASEPVKQALARSSSKVCLRRPKRRPSLGKSPSNYLPAFANGNRPGK